MPRDGTEYFGDHYSFINFFGTKLKKMNENYTSDKIFDVIPGAAVYGQNITVSSTKT